jgi:hypothetical protein
LSLAANRQELLELLKEHLAIIASGDAVHRLGASFEEAAQQFQAIGCCNLLLNMDPEGLYRNLVFSAYGRLYYLKRSRSESVENDLHLAISRNESFFDALAAGRLDLAREIVELSPRVWIPDGEYEDDFCYYAFFHQFIGRFEQSAREPLAAGLDRFEEVLDGAPSPRLDVCRAFLTGSAEDFGPAFQMLLDERSDWFAEHAKFAAVDMTFAPRKAVFVEGLALLWIADRVGFPTLEEYPMCPKAARRPPDGFQADDIFAEIDAIIRS